MAFRFRVEGLRVLPPVNERFLVQRNPHRMFVPFLDLNGADGCRPHDRNRGIKYMTFCAAGHKSCLLGSGRATGQPVIKYCITFDTNPKP